MYGDFAAFAGEKRQLLCKVLTVQVKVSGGDTSNLLSDYNHK
jgi:hypothetical protein